MCRCRCCDRVDSRYRTKWKDYYCSECYRVSRKAIEEEDDFTIEDLYRIMGEDTSEIFIERKKR